VVFFFRLALSFGVDEREDSMVIERRTRRMMIMIHNTFNPHINCINSEIFIFNLSCLICGKIFIEPFRQCAVRAIQLTKMH